MSIFDDLMGRSSAKASNAAALDTYGKQQSAISGLNQYGDQYASQFQDMSKAFDPYTQAGSSALQRLMQGLGLGGAEGSAQFADSYRALPGYQAGLDTGGRTVAANANAGNMLQSGATLKALQRYGSDYEDQRSGDYLTRLMGLQGQGLQATGQQVGTQAQGLQGQLQARTSAFGGQMQAAPVIGQGQIAGEQAKQGALTNLMGTAAYLGGSYLGGPAFAATMKPQQRQTSYNPTPYQPSPWG